MLLCLQLDRFIPNRSGLDMDLPHFALPKENQSAEASREATPNKEEYKKLLAASLNLTEQPRILSFKHKAPAPPEAHINSLSSLYNSNLGQAPSRKQYRHIPQTQDRILDAPDLVDDYYLNLLDWSSGNQVQITACCCSAMSHTSCKCTPQCSITVYKCLKGSTCSVLITLNQVVSEPL